MLIALAGCSSGSGSTAEGDGPPTNDIARILGGDTGQPSPDRPAPPPSPTVDIPLGDRAKDVVRAVPLEPRHWGSTYEKQEGYEEDSLARFVVGDDCTSREDGTIPGAVANLYRYTFSPTASGLEQVFAVSGATAFEDVTSAKAAIDKLRDDAKRCPSQTLAGGARLTSVTTDPHDLADVDEALVMEAIWVDAKGERNAPYVWVMARKGSIVVAVLAVDLKAPDVKATEEIAFRGAALVVKRLTEKMKAQ
ncbi:hypothetical protein [Streptodolium elevatio]|uniref:PknH-like extracellular domain-containing protein n=1 Tax=Streptodolium elevatio TaxID=3157996 RepID=A0ABV3DJ36_9ACTN